MCLLQSLGNHPVDARLPMVPQCLGETFPNLSCMTLTSSQVLGSGLEDAESRMKREEEEEPP